MMRKSAAATAYARARSSSAIKAKGLTSARRGPRAHTKASASLRLLHRSRRAGDRRSPSATPTIRRPCSRCAAAPRSRPRRRAAAHQGQGPEDHSRGHAGARMEDARAAAHKCRPALNYYLVGDWPDEYADDYQSRFINERVHANIQKDGTYSVVPRMWGGVTSASELRAIADVVDKFAIPTVKVTGGQRIDLLGVTQGRPAGRLGGSRQGRLRLRPRLRKGRAHGEDLRRLRLVPLRHAGFDGPRDSHREIHVGLVDAGQSEDGASRAARAIAPRRPARTSAIICVDSGYEIHFAGAAGLDIKGTEVLGPVKSEDEALEHVVALVQMYREQGRYLERIYKWTKRIGDRRNPPADHDRYGEAQGAISTASSSARSSRRSIRGRSAFRARTSTSSSRWRPSAWRRRRSSIHDFRRHRKTLRHSAAGRTMRRHAVRQDCGLPHRRGSRLRARRSLPA